MHEYTLGVITLIIENKVSFARHFDSTLQVFEGGFLQKISISTGKND